MVAVDEITVPRGHLYPSVVLDYLSGRVLFIGKDRKVDTISGFLDRMSLNQRQAVEAVAMDMGDPLTRAAKKLPHAKIVLDLFHVVASFSRTIDKIRNIEHHKAP